MAAWTTITAIRTKKVGLPKNGLYWCLDILLGTSIKEFLIEIQKKTLVQETRNAFQNTMQDKFINTVERLSGRQVMAFFSDHHVGPDIEIELFILAPPKPR